MIRKVRKWLLKIKILISGCYLCLRAWSEIIALATFLFKLHIISASCMTNYVWYIACFHDLFWYVIANAVNRDFITISNNNNFMTCRFCKSMNYLLITQLPKKVSKSLKSCSFEFFKAFQRRNRKIKNTNTSFM